jgi:hypothetical protein
MTKVTFERSHMRLSSSTVRPPGQEFHDDENAVKSKT